MAVRLWLLWQSFILCSLIFIGFLGYRVHLQTTRIRNDVRLVRDLLMVWTQTWGQKPEDVRAALASVVSRMAEVD